MLQGYKFSNHLLNERIDRVVYIGETIGFGEIQYRIEMADKIEAITSTGILIVLSKREDLIVTIYPVSMNKATAFFRAKDIDHVPIILYNTIQKNMKKGYLKNCP